MAYYCKSSEVERLKEEAKQVVDGVLLRYANASSSSSSSSCTEKLLRLIDALCRLGIAHHFKQELHQAFQRLLPSAATSASGDLDLLHTSLLFRLLRQHAMPATPAVFDKFKNANGKFTDEVTDTEGLLNLYEASHLGFRDEQTIEDAKDFSYKILSNLLQSSDSDKLNDHDLCQEIQLSLQTPLHWRMPRVEACNFIHIYGGTQQHSSALLCLAKLEYNLNRELYLDELKQVTEWWRALKGKNDLSFARDRLDECYFWVMGSLPEPEVSKGRKNMAIYACLATVLDDIYDIQGSLDDLQKFTEAVNQWDINAVNELPDYMKVFYSAMVENGEQTVRDASEHLHSKIDFIPYIKEQWASYCKALQVEAKWSRKRYMPSFQEYMGNAWLSIGIVPSLMYALLAHGPSLAQYFPGCLDNWADSEFFYLPCLISRLHDDLSFSEDELERGEPNAVLCYMAEHGMSRQDAEVHVKHMLNNAWTRFTDLGRPGGNIPYLVHNVALNLIRSVQRIYLHGDWFGDRTKPNQDCMAQYLLTPIH